MKKDSIESKLKGIVTGVALSALAFSLAGCYSPTYRSSPRRVISRPIYHSNPRPIYVPSHPRTPYRHPTPAYRTPSHPSKRHSTPSRNYNPPRHNPPRHTPSHSTPSRNYNPPRHNPPRHTPSHSTPSRNYAPQRNTSPRHSAPNNNRNNLRQNRKKANQNLRNSRNRR